MPRMTDPFLWLVVAIPRRLLSCQSRNSRKNEYGIKIDPGSSVVTQSAALNHSCRCNFFKLSHYRLFRRRDKPTPTIVK
jgi:hypothetical protein